MLIWPWIIFRLIVIYLTPMVLTYGTHTMEVISVECWQKVIFLPYLTTYNSNGTYNLTILQLSLLLSLVYSNPKVWNYYELIVTNILGLWNQMFWRKYCILSASLDYIADLMKCTIEYYYSVTMPTFNFRPRVYWRPCIPRYEK